MIAYIDTSVLLRVVLNQKGSLVEFKKIQEGVSSRLIKTEAMRTLDRLKANRALSEEDYLAALDATYEFLKRLEIIPVTEEILERAGQPLGMALGTLDAIHLFSAVLWKEKRAKKLQLLTHDTYLARGARLLGIDTLGVDP